MSRSCASRPSPLSPWLGRGLHPLDDRAALHDATLITTEKDWVRLPPDWRPRVTSWPVTARFEDEAGFARLLTGG